jgi:hypothetical protein
VVGVNGMTYDFQLNYDDLAEHIYTELIDLGYAPEGDEVLDIADFMMDFILNLFANAGVEMYMLEDDTEGEDD